MKIVHKNLKKGEIKLQIENLDDLWYLSTLIDVDDTVKGQTFRKIKIGEEGQRNQKVVKKKIFISLGVEKVDYDPGLLRVSGKITEGTDEVPKGDYHTFNIEEGSIIEIIKEQWLFFQLDKLKEAVDAKQPNILICVCDRENALFALSTRKGYNILGSLEGEVQKKEERASAKGGFFVEVLKTLEEYTKRHKVEHIILASPAFWKDEVMKLVKDTDIKKKITLATCSSVGDNAINEVLKRQEVQQVLKQDRITRETKVVDELLAEIKKDGAVEYGIDKVEEAANAGAVKDLLVTDSFIHKLREEEEFDKLDNIMKTVEATKGKISIISAEHDAGKKLDGLGGIASLLRYNLE